MIIVSTFWKESPHLWFNASSEQDEIIGRYFTDIIDTADSITCLDRVILYDQFPRHYYRQEAANHIILYFLRKAIHICDQLDDVFLSKLDDTEWIFYMMPYRHNGQVSNKMISEAWERLRKNKSCLMIRFIKATLKNLPINFNIEYYPFSNNKLPKKLSVSDLSVLDNSSTYNKHVENHSIDIQVQQNIHKQFDDLVKYIQNQSEEKQTITLMLSGGVDSMVCLDSLIYIKADFVALHVNYCNQSYSSDEEIFLRNYCEHRNVNLHVRRISEISRQDSMDNSLRVFYETYTKECKFNGINLIGNKYILFGHNKDDVIENIFTNIAKRNYENIFGMSRYTDIHGHEICRPMLDITKNDILKYARDHKIPYFKNSTPIWSQRGQIRTNIIPCLSKWNEQFIHGLYELPMYIYDLQVVKQTMIEEIIQNIEYLRNVMYINIQNEKVHLYKLPCVWVAIFKSMNVVISRKSICNFIKGISFRRDKTYILSKHVKLKIIFK